VDYATYDSAIAEALRMGLHKAHLQVLTARTGSGKTWADAEADSKNNPLIVIK
jgi:excinuclease UvrABC helicase subunit UvrB